MLRKAWRFIVVLAICFNLTGGEKNGRKTTQFGQAEVKLPNFETLNIETKTVPKVLRPHENYFQINTFENQHSFPNMQQKTIRVQPTQQKITPAIQELQITAPFLNSDDVLESEWYNFKQTFHKSYGSAFEERHRKEIFIENRNKVAKFNQEYSVGQHNFVQKLNGYADMLHHEFNHLLNGFNRTARGRTVVPDVTPSAFIKSANAVVPSRVDWRELGAVASVRNQGSCAACYAFAAVGAVEGQHFRKTSRLVELSAQNIIDCSTPYANTGCVGGVMEHAYEYIKDNKGVSTENSYPFEGRDGLGCRYSHENYGAHVTGYVIIHEGDEQSLESAVAHLGPVSVAIDASADSFQFYSDGVYFEPYCKSSIDSLNHAVLVVGYGTELNGQDYWIVKNSYGTEWGIGGYMKIAKLANNHCGIASYASYPLV